MPKYRDGWNDPPPTAVPLDHEPTASTIHKPRRVWKRALTAAACAAVIGLTYALIPIAFAVGGAAIGVWFVGAEVYGWLESKTAE
ncbi:hypothetical protein [Shinella zoogloeoides]|uniref:hypothetical protein n=1 Tax=Shinella zoogloeoides TaxID=352475 RepID=UPI001F5A3CE7|nr:hypothetical protein [Shinella zoogloeoides]